MNSLYSNPRSQHGEISHQATVVVQCTHDKRDMTDRMLVNKDQGDNYLVYGTPTLDMATCRIDRGDLVFQIGTSAVPRGNILNGAPPVTSYLNGLYWRKKGSMPDTTGMTDAERKKLMERYTASKISEGIRFMGVSLGATVPNPDDEADQKTQITVRTQGTMAIHHNGRSNLHPGDTLVWRIPTSEDHENDKKRFDGKAPDRFGRSRVKQTLMTVPMRKEYNHIDSAVIDTMMLPTRAANRADLKKKLLNNKYHETDKFANELRKAMTLMFWLGANPGADDAAILAVKQQLDEESDQFAKGTSKGAMDAVANIVKDRKPVKNTVKDITGAFMGLMLDLERRKVGKVLSYARPGEKVDVLLGSG